LPSSLSHKKQHFINNKKKRYGNVLPSYIALVTQAGSFFFKKGATVITGPLHKKLALQGTLKDRVVTSNMQEPCSHHLQAPQTLWQQLLSQQFT